MQEIIPRPPAFETALARLASDTHAIPPWKIGYLIPVNSQILLFIIFLIFYSLDHFSKHAPATNPAPNAESTNLSPFLSFLLRFSSSRRIGMLADDVFPYFSML